MEDKPRPALWKPKDVVSKQEPHSGDLELIKADIVRARAWAKNHFPTEGGDTLLDGPKFELKFVGDRMFVTPKMYGHVFSHCIEYRLSWNGDKIAWATVRPLGLTGIGLSVRLEID